MSFRNKEQISEGNIKIKTSQEEEAFENLEYTVELIIGDSIYLKPTYETGGVGRDQSDNGNAPHTNFDMGYNIAGGANHRVFKIMDNSKIKRVKFDNYEPLLKPSTDFSNYIATVDQTNSTDAKILEDLGFRVKRDDQLPDQVVEKRN